MFWIRIRMFLDLPDPDPSIIKQNKWEKTLTSTVLWLLYDFLSLKNNVNVPSKSNVLKNYNLFLVGMWYLLSSWSGHFLLACLSLQSAFVFFMFVSLFVYWCLSFLSIHIPNFLSIFLSGLLAFCISAFLLFVYWAACLSVNLSICLSICIPLHLSICQSIYRARTINYCRAVFGESYLGHGLSKKFFAGLIGKLLISGMTSCKNTVFIFKNNSQLLQLCQNLRVPEENHLIQTK